MQSGLGIAGHADMGLSVTVLVFSLRYYLASGDWEHFLDVSALRLVFRSVFLYQHFQHPKVPRDP